MSAQRTVQLGDVLFVGVNRHQYNYFSYLANAAPASLKVHTIHAKKRFAINIRCWPINRSVFHAIRSAAALRLKTKHRENPSRSYLSRYVLFLSYFIQAFLLFLTISTYLRKHSYVYVAIWSDDKWRQLMIQLAAKLYSSKIIYFENGGLPNTTTIDFRGINENNSVPRDAEFYDSYCPRYENSLPDRLTVREPKKNDVHPEVEKTLPSKFIFFPFQVDTDTQIVSHSPWVKNMSDFFTIALDLINRLPEDVSIVIKEHPSSEISYDNLYDRHPRIQFFDISTQELIEKSMLVVTINSSVGLESLLLNKIVISLGRAFYNISGVTLSATDIDSLYKCIMSPNNLVPMRQKRFLQYLIDDYYVIGHWRNPDVIHAEFIWNRIVKSIKKDNKVA